MTYHLIRQSTLFSYLMILLCLVHSDANGDETVARLDSYEIGYTEYRADLPGGMHPYFTSLRACVVQADGTNRRSIAESLVDEPHAWTQFAGWSPDGRYAIIHRGWESPENAAWEEKHQTFRMTEGWLMDIYLLDRKSVKFRNLTEVERVSPYNTGLFFWPGDSRRLGFQALLDGVSCPFRMNLDGTNKQNLTEGKTEFTYGFSASPDGKRIAYHKNYQIYLADADGSNATKIDTGNPFNFVPQWSPDGKWLLFVSGEHYDCHPYVVQHDGTGLKQVGSRNGYRGVVECIDQPAFHSESSDVPIWSADGQAIFFTAKVESRVELMRTDLKGTATQLTNSPENALNYHPKISPCGKWLAFGSNRTGTRQLYVMATEGGKPRQITHVPKGHGALHAHWGRRLRSD